MGPNLQGNLDEARRRRVGSWTASKEEEGDMAKSLLAALFGALVGVLAGVWFVQFQERFGRGGTEPDLWPAAAAAELRVAKALDQEGLATLVALAEELHALRRQRLLRGTVDVTHLFRSLVMRRTGAEESEARGLDFMIAKVSATIDAELNRWQSKMAKVNQLDAVAKGAALRLLAFVKWQEKGGEYEYAYEFWDELGRTAAMRPAVEEPSPRVAQPEPTPRATATPTRRKVVRTPRPVEQPTE